MRLNVKQFYRLLPTSFAVPTSPDLDAFVSPLSCYFSSLPVSEFVGIVTCGTRPRQEGALSSFSLA